jgi:hypothetical protein
VLAGEKRDPARSLVFHYDVAGKRTIAGQSLIATDWRFTRWAEAMGEEFYDLRTDPAEYRNRVDDPAHRVAVSAARMKADLAPPPKPGPVTSPRALVPASGKSD